jgi:hypothetical protein
MKASSEFVTGPRALRDPRSREYAIQTIQALKRYLESTSIDAKRVEDELEEIRRYKHWEVLGFKSLDTYLKAEVGITHGQLRRRLAGELAADPTVTAAAPPKTAGPGRGHKTRADGTCLSRGSNQASTIVRRLKRDHPDIAKALARGEFKSARAAAIAAGIVKPPTPLDRLRKEWAKSSEDDRNIFLSEVGNMAKKSISQLLAESRAAEAKLPRFECACGQVLWAEENARITCSKCFGAFRLRECAA